MKAAMRGVSVLACGVCLVGALVDCNVAALEAALEEAGVGANVTFEMHLERWDASGGTFTVLTPPPTHRNLFLVETVNGKIVVLGGLDESGDYSSAVEIYDPATSTWTTGAPWSNSHDAEGAVVGNLLCAMGGDTGLDLAPVRTVDCYDVTADAWTSRAPIPETVGHYFRPVVANGKIYVLGSERSDSQSVLVPYATAAVYDPVADTWASLTSAPSPRAAQTVLVGDKAYLVGGFTGNVSGSSNQSDVGMQIYDLTTDSWSSAPDMPSTRLIAFGVDPLGTEIAAYFGLLAGDTLDRFSTATNTWTPGTEPAQKLDVGVYTTVVNDGKLYVLDVADDVTSSSISSSGKLWQYDPAANAWTLAGQRSPDNRDALFFGQPIDQSIYFVGAFTSVSFKGPSGSVDASVSIGIEAGVTLDAGASNDASTDAETGESFDGSDM